MMSWMLDGLRDIEASSFAVDDGQRRLTYSQLRSAVEEEQRWLQRMNVQRCALLADNGAPWIVADLALLGIDALNVPIPTSFTSAQVDHALQDAAIESVLTDDVPRWLAAHPMFAHVGTSEHSGLALLQRRVSHGPSEPAVSKVTYTSGSTGAAKGVCLKSGTLETVAKSVATATASLGITRHMCLLPLPTLLENITGVYVPLLLGAEVCVRPAASIGMSYSGLNVPLLLQAISTTAPESLIVVPELLRVLVQATRNGWHAPASLRFVAVGGAVVSAALLRAAHEARLPVYQGYGLSECASVVCLNTPSQNKAGSVGKPLPHARVRIDTNGEICVRGAVMSGYLGGVERPFPEIRTGDLGSIDVEGFVSVHGRLKNVLITGMGRNITPEWIEGELTAEPAILQAFVVGEGRPHLAALLVPAANVSSEAVAAAVDRANARLPDYARVRCWTSFAEAPSVANGLLTTNGRLRRSEVLTRFDRQIEQLYAREEADTYEFS